MGDDTLKTVFGAEGTPIIQSIKDLSYAQTNSSALREAQNLINKNPEDVIKYIFSTSAEDTGTRVGRVFQTQSPAGKEVVGKSFVQRVIRDSVDEQRTGVYKMSAEKFARNMNHYTETDIMAMFPGDKEAARKVLDLRAVSNRFLAGSDIRGGSKTTPWKMIMDVLQGGFWKTLNVAGASTAMASKTVKEGLTTGLKSTPKVMGVPIKNAVAAGGVGLKQFFGGQDE